MDYRDFGFNQFMEKNPYLDATRYSSLQTKGVFPVGAISFDKASGGQLTIGGKDNSGGVISVQDDDANEKILIDSSGITITDGKITIRDVNGTTIIDGIGLVSSGSFTFDSVVGTGTQTTTAVDWVDITGLTLTFTLTRSAQVLFFITVVGYTQGQWDDSSVRTCYVALDIDGSIPSGFENIELVGARFGDPSAWLLAEPAGLHYPVTLAAGTHTAKLKFLTSNSGYDAGIYRSDCRLSYLVLGK